MGVLSHTEPVVASDGALAPAAAVPARSGGFNPGSGRVLVAAYGHIADTMAAIPALRSIRQAWPDAVIDVLVLRSAEQLVARCPYVNGVIAWTDFRYKGSRLSRVEKAATVAALATRLHGRYKAVLVLHNSAAPMRLLSRLIGAPVRAGVTHGADGYTHPALPAAGVVSSRDENARVLAAVGVSDDGEPIELWPAPSAARTAASLLRSGQSPLVGIHAGSDWSCQQWLPDRFAAVADRLQREAGATIVITGSGSERALQEELARGLSRPPILLAGRTSFDELTEVIRRVDLLVSVNSAPAAIAGALGTPNLVLLGPEDGRHTETSGTAVRRVLQPGGSRAPGSWCELGRWGVLSGCESPMCRGVGGLDRLTSEEVAAEAVAMLASLRDRSLVS